MMLSVWMCPDCGKVVLTVGDDQRPLSEEKHYRHRADPSGYKGERRFDLVASLELARREPE